MRLNYYALGKKIRTIRKKKYKSQMRFSEAIGKSTTYISYIETGKKSMSLDTFVQIANALCVSPDILLAEQVTTSAVPASQELTIVLRDCSDFERLVIIDTLKSMKTALREHRYVLKRSSSK